MFSFFNKTMSNNTETFFDLNVNSINGDVLNLSKLKGKTIQNFKLSKLSNFPKIKSSTSKHQNIKMSSLQTSAIKNKHLTKNQLTNFQFLKYQTLKK